MPQKRSFLTAYAVDSYNARIARCLHILFGSKRKRPVFLGKTHNSEEIRLKTQTFDCYASQLFFSHKDRDANRAVAKFLRKNWAAFCANVYASWMNHFCDPCVLRPPFLAAADFNRERMNNPSSLRRIIFRRRRASFGRSFLPAPIGGSAD